MSIIYIGKHGNLVRVKEVEMRPEVVRIDHELPGGEQPKFKPGQGVVVANVHSASSVGYLGVHLKIVDYIMSPRSIWRNIKTGVVNYPCVSDNGYFTRWDEDELKG